MKHLFLTLAPCLLVALALPQAAVAEIVDFETQTVARGGNATGIPDSPLTIGVATVAGGELLKGDVELKADQTGVYATEGLFGSGETNPLVITFASPVKDFSLFVVNADDAEAYTVSDDLGDSVMMSLASASDLGAALFSLQGNGLTSANITSSDSGAWNFAIDDVTFTAASPAPEPPTLLLLAATSLLCAGLGGRYVRQQRNISN